MRHTRSAYHRGGTQQLPKMCHTLKLGCGEEMLEWRVASAIRERYKQTRPIKAQPSDFSELGLLRPFHSGSGANRQDKHFCLLLHEPQFPPGCLRIVQSPHPSFPTSLCSLFPRHNDRLPPQRAGLPSMPCCLAARAVLTSVSTRKSKSGPPSRVVPLHTCATFISEEVRHGQT